MKEILLIPPKQRIENITQGKLQRLVAQIRFDLYIYLASHLQVHQIQGLLVYLPFSQIQSPCPL